MNKSQKSLEEILFGHKGALSMFSPIALAEVINQHSKQLKVRRSLQWSLSWSLDEQKWLLVGSEMIGGKFWDAAEYVKADTDLSELMEHCSKAMDRRADRIRESDNAQT